MSVYKPRSELTQEEAIESITRRELRQVREKFGLSLVQDFQESAKVEDCMWAMVWLFEHRADPSFTDEQLDDFAIGEIMHYFTTKEFDGDESPAGKEPGSTPSSSPNGALSPVSLPASTTN